MSTERKDPTTAQGSRASLRPPAPEPDPVEGTQHPTPPPLTPARGIPNGPGASPDAEVGSTTFGTLAPGQPAAAPAPSLEKLPDDKWNEVGRVIRSFEDKWKLGTAPAIEDHLKSFGQGDPCRSVLLLELLHVDLEYRVRVGQPVTVGGYLRRYPELSTGEAADLFARLEELRSRFTPAPMSPSSPPTSQPSAAPARSDTEADRVVTLLPAGDPGTPAGGAAPALPLPQRFKAVEFLGRGGMGEVWRVRRAGFDRDRVLKLILPQYARTPEARERMRREAQAMDRIAHPHAVIVHDFGMEPSPYIEMEYIPGKTLDKVMQKGVPKPLDWTVRILGQLCDALQSAHDQGVIHRDLKPSNLMLADGHAPGKEFLKVLDFGIAKIVRADEMTFTGQGQTLGTVLYMSPEQLKDAAHVTPASDVYSVGVIAYEFLTGCRPFVAENLAEYVYDIVQTPAPRFAERNPRAKVPPGVENLVLRCLEKDPRRRPASAAEFAAELRQLALPPPVPSGSGRATRRAILAAAVPLLGVGGYAIWRSRHPAPVIAVPPKPLPPEIPLPANWKAAAGAKEISTADARYPSAIERHVEGVNDPVVARLVVPVPNPKRRTSVPDPFYIMENKVWVGLFAAFASAQTKEANAPQSKASADPRLPVMNVTGLDAESFAAWLGGATHGLLPTQDQWDEAAGVYAKEQPDHPEGPFQGKWDENAPRQSRSHPEIAVNFAEQGDADGPVAVGLATRDISPSGCRDMSGNGREWTRRPEEEKDDASNIVFLRGGSFRDTKPATYESIKASKKRRWPFDTSDAQIGFRVVIEVWLASATASPGTSVK